MILENVLTSLWYNFIDPESLVQVWNEKKSLQEINFNQLLGVDDEVIFSLWFYTC